MIANDDVNDRIYPRSQIVGEGADVKITCISHTVPKWSHDDITLYAPRLQHTLKLVNVKQSDSRVYTCKGYTIDGTKFKVTSELQVLGEYHYLEVI